MSLYSWQNDNAGAFTLLRAIPLFDSLDDEQLRGVANSVSMRTYDAGVTLFHQQMPGTMLYIIEKGSVRVYSIGLSGQEHTFLTFGPREFFGELSLLDGQPRSASAITLEKTTVWLLPRQALEKILADYPLVMRAMLNTLVARVRTTALHAEAIIFQDVLGRLAFELLNLNDRHGRRVDGEKVIAIPLSQTDLGSIVGATRESVNKALATLRKAGLIKIEGAHLTILDTAGMIELVHERGR